VGTSYKEVENDELATPHREGVLPTTEKLHILFTQEWHQIGIPLYNTGSRHVTGHTPVLCRDFSRLRARESEHHQSSTMLRPSLVPRIGASCRIFRRSLHHVPRLSHDFVSDGVPGLLGPAGFDISWTQYQSLMVDRLNRLTAGTSYRAYPLVLSKQLKEELRQLLVSKSFGCRHSNYPFAKLH
jgi:hypothetical protein